MPCLDHRYYDAKKAASNKSMPTDQRVRMLVDKIALGKCADSAVDRAYDIYRNEYARETIECLLLGGATPQEIFTALKVKDDVTEAYTYLFFDVALFNDDLDRIAYANAYKASEYGHDLKKIVMELGKYTMLVRLSRGEFIVPPDAAHNSIRNTSFMLAQLAKSNPVSSKVSQDAFRWAQLCLRSAENAPETDRSAADEINIAVSTRDGTTNKDDSGLKPEDILH